MADEHAACEDADVTALRDLLLGVERRRLDAIESRLEAHERERLDRALRAREHAEVLAASLRLANERDPALGDALRPPIEDGIRRSIREDPTTMAEALYPVLGPAVRRLIASLFEPSENDRDSGYRLEQLFLISREDALVLSHLAFDPRAVQDVHVVSGMLDAIRSFVQDAFDVPDFDGMRTLKVGDVTVWVEWGPVAVLAVVVRGLAPERERERFADALRQLHVKHADALAAGDPRALAPPLEELRRATEASAAPAAGARGSLRALPLVLAAVTLTALWIAESVSDERRWSALLRRLDATPGIVVVAAEREGDRGQIHALRDPLAEAPDGWLGDEGFAELDLSVRYSPYLSLEREIVQRRVARTIGRKRAVGARLEGDRLVLAGGARLTSGQRMHLVRLPGVRDVVVGKTSVETHGERRP